VYDAIRLGQQKLKVRGDLEVAATIGSGGKGQPCRMQFPVSIRFAAGNEEDRIRTYTPDDREL
jgi:hypothetical protein